MRKASVIILTMLILSKTNISQEGWITLFTELNVNARYSGMQFLNNNTGYLTNSWGNEHYNGGYTSKTTNGGYNWVSVEGSVARGGLFFLDEETGWTFGGYWDDAGKRSREVFRTTNGGGNFSRIYIDSTVNSFQKIFFADYNTGWISCMSGVLKTTNSGFNWFECSTVNILPIFFISSSTGWGAYYTGDLYKTTDGGANWNVQLYTPGNSATEIYLKDRNTGWFSGPAGMIYKTTNSGVNWIPYSTGVSGGTSSIEFVNYSKGWACGNAGLIIYTSNGGINWVQQNTGVNYNLGMISFPSENTGYVIGVRFSTPYSNDNILMKTTTGGITFVNNISKAIPSFFSIHQNYPNPFNPVTKIKFSLSHPSKGGAMEVKLVVYDVLGREITVLVNEQLQPGVYEVEWDGTDYPSGVYFYKLITVDYTETRKMILIK